MDKAVSKVLFQRGFTPENTLFGHSVCSDEVNNRKEQLIPLMTNRWGEGFTLGGLGGLPFAGKSGFGAYLHHVPDSGKLLVIFSPHVGIDEIGRVGSLQRDGQAKTSTACGAAIGAYKELQKTKKTASDPLLVFEADNPREFDPQLKQIVNLLAPRLKGIENSSDSIAFVTYQMYGVVRELITACITETPDLFDFATEVAVVGGIMINRRKVRTFMMAPAIFIYTSFYYILWLTFKLYFLVREEISFNHYLLRLRRRARNRSICSKKPLVLGQICYLCLVQKKQWHAHLCIDLAS